MRVILTFLAGLPWTKCKKCGEYIDHLGRCGCDYK